MLYETMAFQSTSISKILSTKTARKLVLRNLAFITNNAYDSFYNFTGPTIRLLPCAPEEGVDRRLSFLGRHVLRAEHLEIMPIFPGRMKIGISMGCPANSWHAYFFEGPEKSRCLSPIARKFCSKAIYIYMLQAKLKNLSFLEMTWHF